MIDPETIKQLSWPDRITLARNNDEDAVALIASIRDEAREIASRRHLGYKTDLLIADAADDLAIALSEPEHYVPEGIAVLFDELDALMFDDGADEEDYSEEWPEWSDADKMRIFGDYR